MLYLLIQAMHGSEMSFSLAIQRTCYMYSESGFRKQNNAKYNNCSVQPCGSSGSQRCNSYS